MVDKPISDFIETQGAAQGLNYLENPEKKSSSYGVIASSAAVEVIKKDGDAARAALGLEHVSEYGLQETLVGVITEAGDAARAGGANEPFELEALGSI